MQYTARPPLCLCIPASLCVFVARGIEEKMGLTFAYMPPRTYTRLAEYVQQFYRAIIGGQMSYRRADRLGDPAGHEPASLLWLAYSGV
jgi:hypothetical protein